MSKISDLYDDLVSRTATQLGVGWRKLPNPYKPEENGERYLELGYGVAFGPGTNTHREIGCTLSVSRQMIIVLTRKVFAREDDDVGREDTAKDIFEDQLTLLNHFEQNASLGGIVANSQFISDGGIEYVFGEKDNFLVLRSTLEVEYFQTLT